MNKQSNLHRHFGSILVAATVMFVAAPALAAPGGGFPWVNWAVSLVNLAIFLGIIIYFAGPKIQDYFRDRAERLQSEIKEAKRLREEAQAKLDEYQSRLDKLEDERQQLMDDYHKQGEREKEKLVADAKRQIEKMRNDAELVIKQEVRRAVASIEQQAVDLAVDVARKSLEKKVDGRVQNELVSQYVDDLKTMEG